MDAIQSRSRSVVLAWRPCAGVYDTRSALVELLDERFDVDSFRIDGGHVGVVLAGGREVVADVQGLTVYSIAPAEADAERMGEIVESVTRLLKAQPLGLVVSLQHIVPWLPEAAHTDVYENAVGALFGGLAEELHMTDFALLADGRRGSGDKFQFEFGVIDAEEAPLRMARLMGRASGHKPKLHEQILEASYPAVSTFVDSTWETSGGDVNVGDVASWVRVAITEAESEAAELVDRLHSRLTSRSRVEGVGR